MDHATSTEQTVSDWIEGLKSGDDDAASKLWNRYLRDLTELACKMLRNSRKRDADEEDIVAKTFAACFRALQEGRYPALRHRDELWRMLVRIADNAVKDQARHRSRAKRGGDGLRGDSAFENKDDSASGIGIWQVEGPSPTPELILELKEALEVRYQQLAEYEDEVSVSSLVRIAQEKLEGRTNKEIAERLECSVPTVERRLRLIREAWSQEGV